MLLRQVLSVLTLITYTSIASAQVSLQSRIDTAFGMILKTKMGQQICKNILGAKPDVLVRHLGISSLEKAEELVKSCGGSVSSSEWIYPSSPQDIQKLTLGDMVGREYLEVSRPTLVSVESWTEPYNKQTYFFSDEGGLPFWRLVQLLAHETAVYFDSKSNPLHPDAKKIPALRDLELVPMEGMNPLIAISDPIVAHTLTFVRALQVEYAIVDELVNKRMIEEPLDFNNRYIRYLISSECQSECLEELIIRMRKKYLPIALPLLAFSPYYRRELGKEVAELNLQWETPQWTQFQQVINEYPTEFLKGTIDGVDHLSDNMQRIFEAGQQSSAQSRAVTTFMAGAIWDLELPAVTQATTTEGIKLLEFMKKPLLSGYNILLSSGPRVRIRIGGAK